MTGTASHQDNEKRVRGAMSEIVAPPPSRSSATSRNPASAATSDYLSSSVMVVR